jgi:hypothetical protein
MLHLKLQIAKPGVKINIDFEGKKKKKRKLTGWDIAMNYACKNI